MAKARMALPGAGHGEEGLFLLRPDILVRLEGLTALVLSVWWYGAHGGSWVLFAVLFLFPDVSMLGYLGGPRVGAAAYNLVHTYTTAGIIGAVGLVAGHPLLVYLALILTAHIGIDRILGFGLKYPTGFNQTYVQRL